MVFKTHPNEPFLFKALPYPSPPHFPPQISEPVLFGIRKHLRNVSDVARALRSQCASGPGSPLRSAVRLGERRVQVSPLIQGSSWKVVTSLQIG